MSSQLGTENTAGERTDCHDSCSNLVVDIFRRLPSRVWRACLAVAQASSAIFEVRALRDPVAWPDAWPCTPGILAVGRASPGAVINCSRELEEVAVAGVLLAKLLEGQVTQPLSR